MSAAVAFPFAARPPRLTKKETALLAALQGSPNQCLSRTHLLRTVWGYQEGARSRTVDVHVQRLRRKIGPALSAQIMTVFRAGYVWSTSIHGAPTAVPSPELA